MDINEARHSPWAHPAAGARIWVPGPTPEGVRERAQEMPISFSVFIGLSSSCVCICCGFSGGAAMTRSTPEPGPLLSLRTTVILLLAIIVGILAGGLAYLDQKSLSAAVLVGGGAAGAALLLFNNIVDRR